MIATESFCPIMELRYVTLLREHRKMRTFFFLEGGRRRNKNRGNSNQTFHNSSLAFQSRLPLNPLLHQAKLHKRFDVVIQ